MLKGRKPTLIGVQRARPGTDRVFTSPLGRPLRANNMQRRVLVPARDRAGLPWVSFHTFRHTCASLLFEAGRNVAQVAAWLGHADPAFTLRTYVHLMDEGAGDATFMDAAVVSAPATRVGRGLRASRSSASASSPDRTS